MNNSYRVLNNVLILELKEENDRLKKGGGTHYPGNYEDRGLHVKE